MKMIKLWQLKKPIWNNFVLKLNNAFWEIGLKPTEEPSMGKKLVNSYKNNLKSC